MRRMAYGEGGGDGCKNKGERRGAKMNMTRRRRGERRRIQQGGGEGEEDEYNMEEEEKGKKMRIISGKMHKIRRRKGEADEHNMVMRRSGERR